MTTGSHYLDVEGMNVHYLAAGAGVPVVLLHGLGGSAAWWQANMAFLAQRYGVFAVDLPGHGLSDKPIGVYDLDMAERVFLGFMERLKLKSVNLVGHSAGGLVSLNFSLKHPERVEKLVLVNSAGLGREVHWMLRMLTIRGVGEVFATPNRVFLRTFMKRLFHEHRCLTNEFLEMAVTERGQAGFKQALLSALRSGVDVGGTRPAVVMLDRLHELTMPTMIVWGREDRLLPVRHALAAQRRMPAARVHIMPNSGHCPSIERPEEFNSLLVDFLGS